MTSESSASARRAEAARITTRSSNLPHDTAGLDAILGPTTYSPGGCEWEWLEAQPEVAPRLSNRRPRPGDEHLIHAPFREQRCQTQQISLGAPHVITVVDRQHACGTSATDSSRRAPGVGFSEYPGRVAVQT